MDVHAWYTCVQPYHAPVVPMCVCSGACVFCFFLNKNKKKEIKLTCNCHVNDELLLIFCIEILSAEWKRLD